MKRHHTHTKPRMDGLAVARLFYGPGPSQQEISMNTENPTDPATIQQERRDLAAKIKTKKLARREELGRLRTDLAAQEKSLIAMAPAGNELLTKYMNEVDYMADQYRREFGFKNQRASNLELTSHKALCFFFGDTIKARLVDLIRPGGLPEAERRSRLQAVQAELAAVEREYNGIIIA